MFAGRLDDVDRPQAVGRALREQHAAPQNRSQLTGAKWLRGKRRKRTDDVGDPAQLDATEHVAQAALSRIPRPPTHSYWPSGAQVVLGQQQHLNREIGMRQQRREGRQLVKHLHHRPTLPRAADRHHLPLLIHTHDPALERDRMHNPKPVLVKQRVQLGAQRAEPPGLHLDELSVSAHDVNHEPADRHLHLVTRRRQHRLDRRVQRALTQHPDPGHPHRLKEAAASSHCRGSHLTTRTADGVWLKPMRARVYARRMARKERWPRSLTQREPGVEITGGFTYSASGPRDTHKRAQTEVPPPWLMEPASAVLDDLQAAEPIAGLQIVARSLAELNGLTLGVIEASAVTGELVPLSDDLDPNQPTDYGGGNWVPRSLTGPDLLVLIADILQEDLAETAVAWGHARPPCPNHPHPPAL